MKIINMEYNLFAVLFSPKTLHKGANRVGEGATLRLRSATVVGEWAKMIKR